MGPEITVSIATHGSIYIEIPKVACTSIKVALAAHLGVDLDPLAGNPHEAEFPSAKPELSESGPLFPGRYSFAFVRNPWDRLVSCYRDKIMLEVEGFTSSTIRPGVADCLARFDQFQSKMPFDDFIRVVSEIPDEDADEHFRSQHTFVTNLSGEIAVDFIGRFESLPDGLERLHDEGRVPLIELQRLQVTPAPRRYRDYYNRETMELVRNRFRRDIQLFNYDF